MSWDSYTKDSFSFLFKGVVVCTPRKSTLPDPIPFMKSVFTTKNSIRPTDSAEPRPEQEKLLARLAPGSHASVAVLGTHGPESMLWWRQKQQKPKRWRPFFWLSKVRDLGKVMDFCCLDTTSCFVKTWIRNPTLYLIKSWLRRWPWSVEGRHTDILKEGSHVLEWEAEDIGRGDVLCFLRISLCFLCSLAVGSK